MTDDLKNLSDRYFLEATIDRFEDKMAVVITKDGQKLMWPINNLPAECEVGSLVRIILTTSKNDQEEHEKVAKTILNKILKEPNKKDVGQK